MLIVSACHSGTFLTEAMSQANRVVITAARTDRTSFGCSDEYQFTFFDECVLGALPAAADWATLYNDVTGCVNAKEAQLGATPSLPQFFEGHAVSQIGLPVAVTPADRRVIRVLRAGIPTRNTPVARNTRMDGAPQRPTPAAPLITTARRAANSPSTWSSNFSRPTSCSSDTPRVWTTRRRDGVLK